MMSVTVEVVFSVEVETEPGETVCISGSVDKLGNWDPYRALRLKRDTSPRLPRKVTEANHNGNTQEIEQTVEKGDVWMRRVKFHGMEDFQYRYFVCRIKESDNEESDRYINILRYEANLQPRIFSPKEYLQAPEKYDSSVAVFGDYGGEKYVNKGWLTDQSEVELNLSNNPIRMWKPGHRQQTYCVKCTPLNYRFDDQFDEDAVEDEYPSHTVPPSIFSKVYVSVLREGKCIPTLQQKFGEVYHKNDHMVFTAQSTEPESLGFQFDFYVYNETEEPKHVGYCFVLPTDLILSNDRKKIPITGLKHKPIGEVVVQYLIAKPVTGLHMKLDISYQNYWKVETGAVDVGHRGMGSSYKHKKLAAVRENTVTSLQSAGSHGADFVEFDVQLSKDLIPVIYHDFHVCITYRKKKRDDLELFRISVRDLNLAQLQSMKLSHDSKSCEPDPDLHLDDLDPADLQPFPTLQRCFEAVDEHVGFNVEVKYPQVKRDGTKEDDNTWDRNKYIDTILRTCFEHGGKRRIIFSSFDPDTCILMRLKQNRYPVLFLCNGETDFYEPYADIRGQSVLMAMNFATSANILGIDVFAEVLIKNPVLIKSVKDQGHVLFCWGEDNNDKNTINFLKQEGVDGIIYDRIDFYKGRRDSVFKVEQGTKRELLQQFGGGQQNGLQTPEDIESADSDLGSDAVSP